MPTAIGGIVVWLVLRSGDKQTVQQVSGVILSAGLISKPRQIDATYWQLAPSLCDHNQLWRPGRRRAQAGLST